MHAREIFRPFTKQELDFVARFKKGELTVDRGATVLAEGTRNPHLYTVLPGWGFRYKMLPDGRRQIVNYAMPGDLIGLQGSLMGEMEHSVEALSPMMLCVFERDELLTLYREHPELAYDVTWLASREECMLDENLLSVGRRTAFGAARLSDRLHLRRSQGTGLSTNNDADRDTDHPAACRRYARPVARPYQQDDPQAGRTQLLRWRDRGCDVLDLEGLERLAEWSTDMHLKPRPFI